MLGTVSALGVGLLASRNRGSGGLGGVVPASGHPVRYSVSCSVRSTSQHMSVRHSAARGGMPLIVGDLGPARWDLGAPGKRLGKRLGRLGKVPDSSTFNKLVAHERLAFRGLRRHASDGLRPTRSSPVGPHSTRIKLRPVSASGTSVRYPISTFIQHESVKSPQRQKEVRRLPARAQQHVHP